MLVRKILNCGLVFGMAVSALASSSMNANSGSPIAACQESQLDKEEKEQFEPVREAPLPEGFPELTPVGEIRVREYPPYRLARTKMRGAENRAFWTLFQHISANDIPMTAPVEVTYGRKEDDRLFGEAMAFLYQFPQQSAEKKGPAVEIVDVPATTAVSLGVRGELSPADIERASDRLAQWLQTNRERYEESGPLRIMGYNSPFVPAADRFFEVEIPIREVQ